MNTQRHPYKNRILAALPQAEIERLTPHLSFVQLKQEETLLDGEARYGYFMEDGIASVVITLSNGDSVEVGVIGKEGLVGLSVLLGTPAPPGRTFIQIEGSGYRISAMALKEVFDQPSELQRILYRCMHAQLAQATQTAACNRLHNIEERLARWLLTCQDRMDATALHLTHDFLGQMLGAPRTTVTLAAGLLQRAGLIEYARGIVTIQNREALENSACECYRTVRDEYKRLKLL